MPWPGSELINGSFAAIGGALAALVVMGVRLQAGRTIDLAEHPLAARFVRHPDWQTPREIAVFVGTSTLLSLAFPAAVVSLLNPTDDYGILFSYPAPIAFGLVFGLVLALVGIGTVAAKLVTPWEEDILGFTAQYVAVGILVGAWVPLTPDVWWPFLTWITGG